MVNHLSPLGIFHTIITVLALLFAIVALMKDGKIIPQNGVGKGYLILTAVGCLTAFGIAKTGHFTPGHALALLILVLLGVGIFAPALSVLKSGSQYVQLLALSASVYLSLIPTTIETLTRLPVSSPIAPGPDAPIVQKALIGWTLCFVVGVIYQAMKIRTSRKSQ